MAVPNEEELSTLMTRVRRAQASYAEFSQAQVDVIFPSVALVTAQARLPLVKLAWEETGMGILEDNVVRLKFLRL